MTTMTANLQPTPQPAQPSQPPAAPVPAAQSASVAPGPTGGATTTAPVPQVAATPAPPQEAAKKKRRAYRHQGTRRLAPWEQRRKAERERRRRQEAKLKRKAGRPSDYKQAYPEQAHKLALLGCTDKQMIEFFEVSAPTFYGWLKKHPPFLNAIRRGRAIATGQVAHALFRRAVGYSYKTVHVHIGKNGQVVQTTYTKYLPPDTRACIFWLTNRAPEHWKEKMEQAVTGAYGQPFQPVVIHVNAETIPQRPERVIEAEATTPQIAPPATPLPPLAAPMRQGATPTPPAPEPPVEGVVRVVVGQEPTAPTPDLDALRAALEGLAGKPGMEEPKP